MSGYKVVEKFVSINGEGRKAGELACFIRMAYCNLNCCYCDTKWANQKDVSYEIMTKEEILSYIRETGVKNVTLTGGEPLFREEIKDLLCFLSKDGSFDIEIETNGAVNLAPFIDIADNISYTMDYKLPGSGMERKMILSNMDILRECDTVKFVISDEVDMKKAVEIVRKYHLDDRMKVYFSSAFSVISPKDIVEFMMKEGLTKVRLQLQLHKYIWSPDEKGV